MYKDALFKRIRRVISLSFITLLPSLLFELYKFASMYFSLSTYKASVKEFIHFFKISSGDGALSNTPISLVKDRLLSLLSIDLSAFNLVTVLLVVLVLFAIYKLIRSITQSLSIRIERPLFNDVNIPFIYIFGSVLAWLSWWLLVSGRPWTRYALIPIVMATVTCCAIAYIYNNYKRRNTYYITVALIWTLCCIAIYNNPITNGLIKQNEASVKISQAYGNNDLYSFGWWQNPEIQLISGMHTRPYQSEKAPNDAWVLISDLQKQLDIAGYKRDTSLCDEFVEFDYYRICKISN